MLGFAVLFPIAAGFAMLARPPRTRRAREVYVEGVTLATSLLALLCLVLRRGQSQTLLRLTDTLSLTLMIDGVGGVFTALVAFLWPLATLYAFEYMEHEGGENHFFALYTITYGVTLGISMAANLMTLYVFYEFLTLSTLPLVMHGGAFGGREARGRGAGRAGRFHAAQCVVLPGHGGGAVHPQAGRAACTGRAPGRTRRGGAHRLHGAQPDSGRFRKGRSGGAGRRSCALRLRRAA